MSSFKRRNLITFNEEILLADLRGILQEHPATVDDVDGSPLINFRRCRLLAHRSQRDRYRNPEYEEYRSKHTNTTARLEGELRAVDISDNAHKILEQRSREIEAQERTSPFVL
jgi:hypothetical protein